MRFDVNGTVFQDRIRLLQYSRLSNSEKYYNGLYRGNWMVIIVCNDSIDFIQLCLGIERFRFGYVDRMSDFKLTYESNMNDLTVFPGKS